MNTFYKHWLVILAIVLALSIGYTASLAQKMARLVEMQTAFMLDSCNACNDFLNE